MLRFIYGYKEKQFFGRSFELSSFSLKRGPASGGSHVARLNFQTSRVGVY